MLTALSAATPLRSFAAQAMQHPAGAGTESNNLFTEIGVRPLVNARVGEALRIDWSALRRGKVCGLAEKSRSLLSKTTQDGSPFRRESAFVQPSSWKESPGEVALPGPSEGSPAMRVAISRWTIVSALGLITLLATSGCRSGGSAWSTPSWMSNWGWGNSSSTALAQNKPSTSVSRPSSTATPQAVASVAAGTNSTQVTATNPNYSTTGAGYPNASGGYGGYGAQAATAY